jgi:hypothetical protein
MSETRSLIRLLRIYFPRISEFGSASEFRGGAGLNPPNPPRYATEIQVVQIDTRLSVNVPETDLQKYGIVNLDSWNEHLVFRCEMTNKRSRVL